MRETFIIKSSWESVFDDLSDKQAGVLIKAIFSYVATGEKPNLMTDLEVKMAFKFISISIDEEINILDSIRKSSEYRKWRMLVLSRDKYACKMCGNTVGKLHAHHIKKFAFYPHLRFDVANGVTLCVDCHKKIHSVKKNRYE